jgi:hypothetical protein
LQIISALDSLEAANGLVGQTPQAYADIANNPTNRFAKNN